MWPRVKSMPGALNSFRHINSIIQQKVRKISNAAIHMEEQKVCVEGVNINYLRTGVGDHPLILMPGALGSIWTNFRPQIQNLDKEKFTIVAWDPPGYGKSIPPERTFPLDYFHRDANWARSLMKTLGYDHFSVLGWSGGGMTSLVLAAEYPENVRKLVVIGGAAYIGTREAAGSAVLEDLNNWPSQMRKSLLEMYGTEYAKRTLRGWSAGWKNLLEKRGGVVLSKDDLVKIQCPTLLVQGDKDQVTHPSHARYLKENISNSKLKLIPNGSHNLHLERADEVNNLVQEFLLN